MALRISRVLLRCRASSSIALLTALLVALLAIESQMAAAESPETVTTRLQPGLNLVGWISSEVPVGDLFSDVPEIEAAYAWDVAAKHWLAAAPGVPTNLNSLRTLRPGMGLLLKLGGTQPVEWTRRYSRASGFVWLTQGLNLVAWTGVDGNAISNAADSLHTSFTAAHVWDATGGRYLSYSSEERGDSSVPISQGDALWIDVRRERTGYWLQRDDAFETISGFATTVTGEALAGFVVNATTMNTWGGWFYDITRSDGAFRIAVRADLAYRLWLPHPDECDIYYHDDIGRNTPTRSPLIHATQPTQALPFRTVTDPCTSVIRGRLARDDGAPLAEVRLSLSPHDSPDGFGGRTDANGSFRFSVPEDGQYHFGLHLHDGCTLFYDQGDFNSERGAVTPIEVIGGSTPEIVIALPDGVCGWEIGGHVVTSDGEPIPNVWIGTDQLDGTSSYRRPTASDGSFSVTVPALSTYRLWVTPSDSCVLWHRDGGAVGDRAAASLIEVAEQNVMGIRIEIPEQACGTQVNGQLVGSRGEPLGGVQIDVFEGDNSYRISNHTNDDGSFNIFVRDGEIIRLWLDDARCQGYYDGDGVSPFSEDAAPVRVSDIDVTSFVLSVPANVCTWQIRGKVLGQDGGPVTEAGIGPIGVDGQHESVRPVERDGSFAVTVPVPGDYRLHIRIGYCSLFFDGETVSTHLRESGHVSVRGAHVDGVDIRIPTGMCASRVRGFIVDADGTGLSGVYVLVRNYDGMGGAYTEAGGSFEVVVPVDGEYEMLIYAGPDCWLYYGEQGTTVHPEEAAVFRAGDGLDDVFHIRLAEDRCG